MKNLKTSHKLLLGVLVTIIVGIAPYVALLLVNQNEYTIKHTGYVTIYASQLKMVRMQYGVDNVILSTIAGILVAASLLYDLTLRSINGGMFVRIAGLFIGILLGGIAIFKDATTTWTHKTIPAEQFDPKAADKSAYDTMFTVPNQPDSLLIKLYE